MEAEIEEVSIKSPNDGQFNKTFFETSIIN
jgi:hypothetical protein